MTTGLKITLLAMQLLTVGSALIVTFHRNILHASISLLFTFLGVAAMFIYAGADFLAGAQVIIYVGGVTILILFAIMLTQWQYNMKLVDYGTKLVPPIAVVGFFLLPFLWASLRDLATAIKAAPPEKIAEFSASPKTHVIGKALLNEYVLPFEVITILLLGALVGGVWLARPNKA